MASEIDDPRFGDDQQRRVYRAALDELGETTVRQRYVMRVAITDRPETNPPREYTNAWLALRERMQKRAEDRRFWVMLGIGIISAVAAIVAAIPEVRTWLQ